MQGTPWTPDDLGERLWLDWWAEDLSDGTVATWTSRNGNVSAAQSNSANMPTKQNGEVYFAYGQRLTFPTQNKAHIAHRAIAILFRVDLSGSGDGTIFTVNGAGGGYERQPMIGYNRNTKKVSVSWRTPNGYNGASFPIAVDGSQWHCLVSRRVGTKLYASLDGKQNDGVTPGETEIDMADWALPKENTNPIGYIGDFRPSTPPIGIDAVLILQDELSQEDAEKLMGWAMWRRGVEDQLPASHPYYSQPPVSTGPEDTFVESTSAEYSALSAFWYDTDQSEIYKGTAMDLTGWVLDFEDEFDTHTVTNDISGRGSWFAPTHGDPTGSATAVRPALNSSDPTVGTEGNPATYIQSNSTMTIRMQNSGGWKSGAFCSVNSNGYGRTWMYPYVEARMKIGPSSTGNTYGAWPALWLKSRNYFYRLTETNMEYDAYEGYISDNDGYHNSYHNWPAARVLPGRLSSHRYMSNYLGTHTPGWVENVNLFDGEYHTYGVMVTPDWVINMFDGKEMFRFPTPVEMKQPLWILLDLAMSSSETSQASGVYDLTIDYVRVYQNPAYSVTEGSVGASADSYVRGAPYANDNYGTEDELVVKYSEGTTYLRNSYLKFDLAGVSSPASAQLVLTPSYVDPDIANCNFEVQLVSDDSWQEDTISWSNKPSGGTVLATIPGSILAEGEAISMDITTAVLQELSGDGTLSVVIVAQPYGGTPQMVRFGSRESSTPPRLDFPESSITEEVDLESSDDTFVRGDTYGNDNYGSDAQMLVKNANSAQNDREALIKFDLSPLNDLTAAELIITPSSLGGGAENGSFNLLLVDDDSWQEDTVTWNTRPSASTTLANIPGSSLTVDEPYSIDITSVALQEKSSDGVLSLKIVSAQSSQDWLLAMYTHEAGSGQPLLRATVGGVLDSILAEADSFVRIGSYANINYGSEAELISKYSEGTVYVRQAYIRFDLSALSSVSSAELVLTPSFVGEDIEYNDFDILFVSDDSWQENTITWNNKPAGSTVLATIPGSYLSEGVELGIDLTDIAQQELAGDGKLSIAIVAQSTSIPDMVRFGSRESTTPPYLEVE